MTQQQPQFSYPRSALETIAADVLARAKSQGASACEMEVSEGFGQA